MPDPRLYPLSMLGNVPAPSGDEAFGLLALGWLMEVDLVPFLHPAVQAAVADAYRGAHLDSYRPGDPAEQTRLDPYTHLPARAFTLNYDDYHLLRWQSNLDAREQMLDSFPQTALDGDLPVLAVMPESVQEQVVSLTEHRRQLPVIMRKDVLLELGRQAKARHHKPLPPLRPSSLSEDQTDTPDRPEPTDP
jgi:hypothetical protein